MKPLNQYIQEKLVIFPSQVDEKLVINKDYRDNKIFVKSFDELKKDHKR